jgi:cardiolipin synthase
MFPAMTGSHWLTLHGLVTVVAVMLYAITSHVMHQRRHPTAAIAWILFILLVPYLALPAYLAFGSRKLARPRPITLPDRRTPPDGGDWAIQTILALGQPAPSAYRELNVHADGRAAHAALLATIDAARHSIDLCTFILGRDRLGSEVVDHLRDKARSGVRVRLLLDGLGNLMGGRPDLKRLTAAGGSRALFVPPFRSPLKGRTNLRNHRKLLVADAGPDGAHLWCGGRNLATEYFEGGPASPPWHDLSFDLRGPLVQQAAALFEHDWAFAQGQRASGPLAVSADATISADGAQLVASGPDQVDDTLYALLVTAAYRARRRIALVTPYFVPEAALLMALCLAARRGVLVELLLPARSNHRMSDLARGRALRSLAQAGGRVWLAPGMQHAKLAVVDDTLALAGSANLDSRSLFLNYELMFAFHHAPDVLRFARWFDQERAPAQSYVAERPGLARDVAEGMLLWAGFQL